MQLWNSINSNLGLSFNKEVAKRKPLRELLDLHLRGAKLIRHLDPKTKCQQDLLVVAPFFLIHSTKAAGKLDSPSCTLSTTQQHSSRRPKAKRKHRRRQMDSCTKNRAEVYLAKYLRQSNHQINQLRVFFQSLT